jgi:hypothetical protein
VNAAIVLREELTILYFCVVISPTIVVAIAERDDTSIGIRRAWRSFQ